MLPLFLILAPGLLAAVLYRNLAQKPMRCFDFVVYAVIFAFFTASFSFGVVYLRGFGDMQPLLVFGNLRSVVKYCVIATVAAVALPNCVYFLPRLLGKRKRDER